MILLAWAATAYILLAYGYLARYGIAGPFHWANFLGALVLAPLNLVAGLPPQALLSAVFGLVALAAIIKGRRPPAGPPWKYHYDRVHISGPDKEQ
jgi:hypothetical protein